MRVDNILGKLMAITRGIHLMAPSSYERMDAFNSGGGTSMGLRQVTWWVTHKAIVETRELAGMIRKIDREYAEASVAAIQLEIDRVLRANLDDSDLFDLRRVTRGASTLFDAIAADDKRGIARKLWDKILSAVKDLQPRWLVLYPLRGVVADSVDVGFDGLSVMAPTDVDKWQGYSSHYPRTTRFYPAEGSPERFSAPTVWGMTLPTADENRRFTWLICEAKGTESGVIRIVADRMRTLLALLFAQWHPSCADFFVIKSVLGEHRCSLQFAPAGNRKQDAITPGTIGRLMPSLPLDFVISTADVVQIRRWYAAYSSADESLQRRAITACQFIHHAIMADGFERFVHYYIALDAMFGERYKVEENVKGALLQMFPNDPLWSYRADHLFDLRNELIHGGTSSLDKWKGLEAYMRHVKTSPLEDVGRAAMTALRNYFVSPPKFVTA